MQRKKEISSFIMQTYVFLDVLSNYTRGVAVARATSKEDAIQRLLYEKSRYETIYELKRKKWEFERSRQPIEHHLMIENLPESNPGTSDLREFETDLRTTKKMFVISDDVPFAFFNGGGS
jgi:hypothetical protein